MYDSMKMLTDEQKHKIHELACDILSQTGMHFMLDEAREIFKAHGFRFDGEQVFITAKQVENALETVPEQYDVIAPDINKKVHVGGDSKVYSPSCSCTRIQDLDGTVRFATSHDYEKAL